MYLHECWSCFDIRTAVRVIKQDVLFVDFVLYPPTNLSLRFVFLLEIRFVSEILTDRFLPEFFQYVLWILHPLAEYLIIINPEKLTVKALLPVLRIYNLFPGLIVFLLELCYFLVEVSLAHVLVRAWLMDSVGPGRCGVGHQCKMCAPCTNVDFILLLLLLADMQSLADLMWLLLRRLCNQ